MLDQRQSFQSQKIHFQKTCTFYHRIVKLRDIHIRIFGNRYRDKFCDIVWGDDDPASMYSCISNRPFQNSCFIDSFCSWSCSFRNLFEFVDPFYFFRSQFFFQPFFIQRKYFLQFHSRNQLGNSICLVQG